MIISMNHNQRKNGTIVPFVDYLAYLRRELHNVVYNESG